MNTNATKWTPGPWIQVQEIDDSDNSILIRTKKQAIANVLPKPHFCDEQHANARLIASAPELVEALQFALEFCESPALTDSKAFYACEWATLRDAAKLRADQARDLLARIKEGK